MEYLKQATMMPASADQETAKTVSSLLEEIERDGERVLDTIPGIIEALPEPARTAAAGAEDSLEQQ